VLFKEKRGEGSTARDLYESRELPGRYPRLQILTIAQLLEGERIQYPEHRIATFAKAERETTHAQQGLF
jgi:hypothetical protein